MSNLLEQENITITSWSNYDNKIEKNVVDTPRDGFFIWNQDEYYPYQQKKLFRDYINEKWNSFIVEKYLKNMENFIIEGENLEKKIKDNHSDSFLPVKSYTLKKIIKFTESEYKDYKNMYRFWEIRFYSTGQEHMVAARTFYKKIIDNLNKSIFAYEKNNSKLTEQEAIEVKNFISSFYNQIVEDLSFFNDLIFTKDGEKCFIPSKLLDIKIPLN